MACELKSPTAFDRLMRFTKIGVVALALVVGVIAGILAIFGLMLVLVNYMGRAGALAFGMVGFLFAIFVIMGYKRGWFL